MLHFRKITPGRLFKRVLLTFVFLSVLCLVVSSKTFAVTNPQNGGIGMQGTINEVPPTQGATITSPANGASFTQLPVTVTGWCPNGLLVKIYSNGIFSGSVMCAGSSYSAKTDLFSGRNDLTAIVYDSLDQAGPSSNTVTVNYVANTANANVANLVALTSNYARRGADPDQILTWPIIISGGAAPYALSVDWGDGLASDLYTSSSAGEYTIQHTYNKSGTYSVLIKAADNNGRDAYLQLVAVANGVVTEPTTTTSKNNATITESSITSLSWVLVTIIPSYDYRFLLAGRTFQGR